MTRSELKELFEKYDQNVFEGKPSNYDHFVESFLDYHFNQPLYVCMENTGCDCPNPYHTAFETLSLDEAFAWYSLSPKTRMIEQNKRD